MPKSTDSGRKLYSDLKLKQLIQAAVEEIVAGVEVANRYRILSGTYVPQKTYELIGKEYGLSYVTIRRMANKVNAAASTLSQRKPRKTFKKINVIVEPGTVTVEIGGEEK